MLPSPCSGRAVKQLWMRHLLVCLPGQKQMDQKSLDGWIWKIGWPLLYPKSYKKKLEVQNFHLPKVSNLQISYCECRHRREQFPSFSRQPSVISWVLIAHRISLPGKSREGSCSSRPLPCFSEEKIKEIMVTWHPQTLCSSLELEPDKLHLAQVLRWPATFMLIECSQLKALPSQIHPWSRWGRNYRLVQCSWVRANLVAITESL